MGTERHELTSWKSGCGTPRGLLHIRSATLGLRLADAVPVELRPDTDWATARAYTAGGNRECQRSPGSVVVVASPVQTGGRWVQVARPNDLSSGPIIS